MRSRNLQTEERLVLLIGVYPADIPKLRAGAKVTAELALRVSALQGDKNYIAGYFDRVDDPLNSSLKQKQETPSHQCFYW